MKKFVKKANKERMCVKDERNNKKVYKKKKKESPRRPLPALNYNCYNLEVFVSIDWHLKIYIQVKL